MGRIALAVCVACLASSSFAVAQENKEVARHGVRAASAEQTPARAYGEAINESVVRVAMRGAFSSAEEPRLTRQEALGLLLLLSSRPAQQTAK